MDLSAFLEEFKLEALEHLERLGSGLLALERSPTDQGLIRKLFLSAHTVKGGASMLELNALKTLTHAFEDVLARLRDGVEPADSATVTLLLRATDEIKNLVTNDPTRAALSPDLEQLVAALRARARGEIPTPEPEAALPKPEQLEAAVKPEPSPDATTPVALVLEPSSTARLLVRLQLEERGWTVLECADAQALMEAASTAALAVVPVEPGGVNGFEIARDLRALHPGLEIAVNALAFSPGDLETAARLPARAVQLTAWNVNPYWSAP